MAWDDLCAGSSISTIETFPDFRKVRRENMEHTPIGTMSCISAVRMRFAQQCVNELKTLDPSCPVSVHLVRSLAKRGLVPSVQIGNRRLINFDALLDYLENPITAQAEITSGEIRQIFE